MMANIDSVFQEHTVRLSDPTAEAVRDAFAALPRQGCLECVCRWEGRLEVLAALEACGAFAITIEPVDGFMSVRRWRSRASQDPATTPDAARSIAAKRRPCWMTTGI